MKKFTKILSLVLAVSLVASLFTVNVMAASKAHTVTVSLYDAEGEVLTTAKAGDTVTVEVTIDNTANLAAVEYSLKYDTAAFAADTNKTSKVENCIDRTWLSAIKAEDGGDVGDYWAYYLPTLEYNVANAGVIWFAWAGKTGVGSDDAADVRDNRVIGKFYLTVNADVEDGKYEIGLDLSYPENSSACKSNTMDAGENATAAMVSTAKTVTVGEAEEEVTKPTVTASQYTEDITDSVTGDVYDNVCMTTATFTNIDDITKAGVLFIPTALLEGDLEVSNTTALNAWVDKATLSGLGDGNYTLNAALKGIPRKYYAGISITSRAYALYGTDNTPEYADEVVANITFAATAE